jgi:hypothetical protein
LVHVHWVIEGVFALNGPEKDRVKA